MVNTQQNLTLSCYICYAISFLCLCVFNQTVLLDLTKRKPAGTGAQACRGSPCSALFLSLVGHGQNHLERLALSWAHPEKLPAGGLKHLTACLVWWKLNLRIKCSDILLVWALILQCSGRKKREKLSISLGDYHYADLSDADLRERNGFQWSLEQSGASLVNKTFHVITVM